MDEAPEFLIMEFVEGEPLNKYLLRYPNGVSLGAARRRILLDLSSAIEEVHKRGWTRGEMCSSNVLIEAQRRRAAVGRRLVDGPERRVADGRQLSGRSRSRSPT